MAENPAAVASRAFAAKLKSCFDLSKKYFETDETEWWHVPEEEWWHVPEEEWLRRNPHLPRTVGLLLHGHPDPSQTKDPWFTLSSRRRIQVPKRGEHHQLGFLPRPREVVESSLTSIANPTGLESSAGRKTVDTLVLLRFQGVRKKDEYRVCKTNRIQPRRVLWHRINLRP